MTFFPVVERELRVAARRRGTYRMRFLAGVGGVLAAAWIALAIHGSEREMGAAVFGVEAALVFIYTAVAGTLATSDSLSEEKREGTLGLLFLTDLRGGDVVLGKLAATSLHALYGMLAVFPILALPVLMGGVTQMEVLRAALVALNLLFFFLSAGLAASALCRRDSTAYGLAVLVSLFLVMFWPAISQVGRHPNPHPRAALLSSPAYACFLMPDSEFSGTAESRADFWLNIAITHLYAWFFFVCACVLTPRSWKEGATGRRWWNRWQNRSNDAVARADILERNPFAWRVLRRGRHGAWFVVAPFALVWWWLDQLLKVDLFDPGKDLTMLALAGLAIKTFIALTAGRIMGEDRRSGGLELVLTTGLGAEGVLAGQRTALWRMFAWPIGALLLANLAMLILERRTLSAQDENSVMAMHFIVAASLVLDSGALAETAMRGGLMARKPLRAGLVALGQIVALPTVLFLAGVFLAELASASTTIDDSGLWLFWIFLGCIVDGFFWGRARDFLSKSFQLAVSEGVSGAPRESVAAAGET